MASLTLQIKRSVNLLFKALGDLVKPATYYSVGTQATYDVEAGKMVYQTTPLPLTKCAIVKFTQRETDKDPTVSTSEKMLFQTAELKGVEAKSQDWVVDVKGRKWEVVKLLGGRGRHHRPRP
jgi:hypothetical protein